MLAFPYALAAVAFDAFLPADNLQFALIVGGATLAATAVSNAITACLLVVVDGVSVGEVARANVTAMPAYVISILLATAVIGSYEEFGVAGAVAVIVPLFVFMYTINLVATAQQRARRHASLSWGVLSSLVRTLNERDPSAARHSAAVAAFSYAIAQQAGLSKAEQQLAHTAGLLHDIGRFSFADRILQRGHVLTSEDWRAVRRHPEIGAAMLADLDAYGPVAQVVRAHHERVDGLGYPDGLRADEIPEISKIVAVAEVYDTLTAKDTYRDPLSSFQAVNEMRRVAGSQLEEKYVEALAQLLAGRSLDYRHADSADFDRELAIQKKITEAATGS
jgi:putative nucleotidyltransferase with HDIG domain